MDFRIAPDSILEMLLHGDSFASVLATVSPVSELELRPTNHLLGNAGVSSDVSVGRRPFESSKGGINE